MGGFDHGLLGVNFLSSFGEWCSKRGYSANNGNLVGWPTFTISIFDMFGVSKLAITTCSQIWGNWRLLFVSKWPKNHSFVLCRWYLAFLPCIKGDLELILHLLHLYELASGQKMNREKTMVYFSKATTEEWRVELVEFLGVNEVRKYEKCLGLPAVVGWNNKESLNYIKERVWNKLQGWKERLLS